jgi:hypothetical protein
LNEERAGRRRAVNRQPAPRGGATRSAAPRVGDDRAAHFRPANGSSFLKGHSSNKNTKGDKFMPHYRIHFANEIATATTEVVAASLKDAFSRALELAADQSTLTFETMWRIQPVDQITVIGPGSEPWFWQTPQERLRVAGPELLAAARDVLANWTRGDHVAVRRLGHAVAAAVGGGQ